jgi:hypothetical protein
MKDTMKKSERSSKGGIHHEKLQRTTSSKRISSRGLPWQFLLV